MKNKEVNPKVYNVDIVDGCITIYWSEINVGAGEIRIYLTDNEKQLYIVEKDGISDEFYDKIMKDFIKFIKSNTENNQE